MNKKIVIIVIAIFGVLFGFLYTQKNTEPTIHNEMLSVAQSVIETENSVQKNTFSTIELQNSIENVSDHFSKLHSQLISIDKTIQTQIDDKQTDALVEEVPEYNTITHAISFDTGSELAHVSSEQVVNNSFSISACWDAIFADVKILPFVPVVQNILFHL
jgi:predicted transcriptional regulator